MIGQSKLLSKIDSYNLSTFPNTILITGEEGSGKHLVASYIANRFNYPLVDITKVIDNEVIENIYRSVSVNFYLIDLDELTEKFAEKNQNTILKFIEEPLKNSFIILLAENKYNLLDTINNRCINFEMDKYSDEELLNFCEDINVVNIVRTPGKLLLCRNSMQDIEDLCDKICTSMGKANFANALTLVDKFNYEDDYDKIDINIFLDVLLNTLFNKYKLTNNIKLLKTYLLVDNEVKKLRDKRLNKKIFMQHLIINIWKEATNGQ